jgi:radical SAM superfamily enzyme YgiQ (UPF0313 family)
VRNPRAERTREVDRLPWPAWELFDLDVYDAHDFVDGIKFGKTVPILATRGCPYQCTYCSSPQMWTTRWYARDPASVADDQPTPALGDQLPVSGSDGHHQDWVVASAAS